MRTNRLLVIILVFFIVLVYEKAQEGVIGQFPDFLVVRLLGMSWMSLKNRKGMNLVSFSKGMKLVIFFVSVVTLITSMGCGKEPPKDDNPESKKLLPGLNAIGRGYNIFDLYADPRSIRPQKLFDFGDADEEVQYGDFTYQKYRCVDFHELSRGHIDVVSEENIQNYSSSFSLKAKLKGNYSFFRAQLEADFGKTLERHREYFFTTINDYFEHWLLAVPESSELIPMLTKSARNDLKNMDPETLFDTYGTHFVAGIVVGGRAKYSIATEKSDETKKLNIKAMAEASYKSSWGISGKVETGYDEDRGEFERNSHIVVDTIGGDPEYAHNIYAGDTKEDPSDKDAGDTKEGSYDKWLESTIQNPVWVDFGTEHPLRPLWELCSSVDRQKALESAYPQYAIDHSPKITVPLYELYKDDDFFAWTNSEDDYIKGYKDWQPRGIVCRLLDRKLLDAKPLYLLEKGVSSLVTTSHDFYRDQQRLGWTGKGELGIALPASSEELASSEDQLKKPETIPLYLLWKQDGDYRSMLTTEKKVYEEKLGDGWRDTPMPDDGRSIWGLQGYVFPSQDIREDTPKDMVLIPAGEFYMGRDDDQDNEKPKHKVHLDAFYMDRYEVTNAKYRSFMGATGHRAPQYWNDDRYNANDRPVVGVSWGDAKAYAEWAGKRLPTEAEWEKAASGGLVGRMYPWGDSVFPQNANYESGHSVEVGQYPHNGYGLYDMGGNVWEWCADRYDKNYYVNSPMRNPTGPSSGEFHVFRGGGWRSPSVSMRIARRSRTPDVPKHEDWEASDVGFRCVQDIKDIAQ